MKTLVIDIGGTHIKLLATGQREALQLPSGPRLTPRQLVRAVQAATASWRYDRISIGYPGPARDDRPAREPWNLGRGWKGYDFAAAFGLPVRLVNDAAMQALGSYEGGRMMFLGLGTGLGTALVLDGVVVPLEVAHLPYRSGRSYEQFLGIAGLERLGARTWRAHVFRVIDLFMAAFEVDYIVLGGGNTNRLRTLPKHVRRGDNANAFVGGFRLWERAHATPSLSARTRRG